MSEGRASTAPSVAPSPIGRDARILALVGTGHFLAHFYVIVLPPLFPLLHAELGISYAALGALMTVVNVTTGAAQVPVGFLVDRLGAGRILIAGMALISGGTALAGMTNGYWGLLALMVVVGAGNSVFHPADYAIMATRIDAHRLGRAFSVHTALGHFGWAIAPLTVATIAALWSWHSALVAVGLAGVVATIVVATQVRFLDASPTQPAAARRPAQTTVRGGIATLLSPAMLMFFAFMVLTAFANSGLNNFSVSVLVGDYGADLPGANSVLTAYFAASTAGVQIGGILADRVRRHELVLIVGFLIAAASLALIASVPLPLVAIGAVFALTGLMFGAIRPSRDMMVRAIAPDGSVGKVFGFVTMGLNLGGALAPIFFGWLIDRGEAEWVFYAAAVTILLALVCGVAGKAQAKASSK